METLGIPELTREQVEEFCLTTEKAARDQVSSNVPSKKIEKLDMSAEVESTKPFRLKVNVAVMTSRSTRDVDREKNADEVAGEAFSTAEECLGKLSCHSQR